VGHGAVMEEMTNAFKILFGNPERKRPLGRSRHRLEVTGWMLKKQGVRMRAGYSWLRIIPTKTHK